MLEEMKETVKQAIGEDYRDSSVYRALTDGAEKLPSNAFAWAIGASIVGAVACQIAGKRAVGAFIGQWAPVLIAMALYNKLNTAASTD